MNLKLSESNRMVNIAKTVSKQAETDWRNSVGHSDWPLSSQTDREQASHKLAHRHSRLLAVLPAGVVVLDGEGYVQEANKAAKDLLGEPLEGERWINVIQRAFKPQPGDGHDVSLRDGRMVHISTSPLDAEPGQILLLQDVSETRALQSKVSHMQRLSTMGEVSARLAHQIRTPLASALLYLAPLLKKDLEPSAKQRFASRLKHSLTHMEQLVKDMLAFSGGTMAAPAPVSVNQLLDDVQLQFLSQADAEQFHLIAYNSVNDGYVYGSQEALVSAINNLLNNARQACGTRGKITLFTELVVDDEQRSWIDIGVQDNGPGIAIGEQEKIMKPFYTTRANGTGLGLPVVQSIAKSHKGQLMLESKEGEGSVFSLRLPVYQAHQLAEHVVSAQ